MNTANKLTIFRIILIIPIIILLMIRYSVIISPFDPMVGVYLNILIFLLYVLAAYTDYLDGKIAREQNIITNFGKLYDPLADKLLVISILIVLVEKNLVSSLIVIILIAREIYVTSYRALYSSKKSDVISAAKLGKLKTLTQMVAIGIILLLNTGAKFNNIILLPSLILSLLSALDYVKNNPIDMD